MNLFILDPSPELSATYNNDSHVRKIILESTELMGMAYDNGKFKPWSWLSNKSRHYNHPMAKFVRASRQNFDWTLQHAYALCNEFVYRFDKNKQHKCHEYLDWISSNLPLDNLPDIGMTEWPRCFGAYKNEIELSDDVVFDYRRYYMLAKRHLAIWTKRETPFWWR